VDDHKKLRVPIVCSFVYWKKYKVLTEHDLSSKVPQEDDSVAEVQQNSFGINGTRYQTASAGYW